MGCGVTAGAAGGLLGIGAGAIAGALMADIRAAGAFAATPGGSGDSVVPN